MTHEEIFLMRRRKRIKLTQIAKAIDYSPSLLSLHENDKVQMSPEKIRAYKSYIINH